MPYLDAATIRTHYLTQLDAASDTTLSILIANVESVVNQELGFTFNGFATAAAQVVTTYGGEYFYLPAHKVNTLSAIVRLPDNAPIAATSYEAESGDVYGNCEVNRALYRRDGWVASRYRVTAEWGYGTVPDSIKEVVAELVVNIWRAKDAGRFSDVQGVEGGNAVGYAKALTAYQKMTLNKTRLRYLGGLRV
jgi:hypothetical protein